MELQSRRFRGADEWLLQPFAMRGQMPSAMNGHPRLPGRNGYAAGYAVIAALLVCVLLATVPLAAASLLRVIAALAGA